MCLCVIIMATQQCKPGLCKYTFPYTCQTNTSKFECIALILETLVNWFFYPQDVMLFKPVAIFNLSSEDIFYIILILAKFVQYPFSSSLSIKSGINFL